MAGQIMAVLENREISTQLAELQLEFQQSALKGRMYYQEQQFGKSQVERANQESLEKKIAETRDRIAGLTVRAPLRGHVFARDIESLAGRYLESGSEIAIVGAEDTKELLIAVCQDDLDQFLAHLGQTVDVRMRSGIGEKFSARLVKANPCGCTELPHPAFAAPVGGPLAVRTKPESQHSSEDGGVEYELLAPSFLVKAQLNPEQSLRLHSGQLTTVTFRSSSETVAMRIFRLVRAWMQKQMAARQAAYAWPLQSRPARRLSLRLRQGGTEEVSPPQMQRSDWNIVSPWWRGYSVPASQRSTSMAALQPMPAAVIA